ncbi:MAG TPA: radical SAM protein [Pirellulales bacterium]|nr:radical SAM protein [Pirellulales bacterium]
MESIYWVVSRDCNQRCPHCYNNSAPGAVGLDLDQVTRCVEHLPDRGEVPLGRIILSGGEVLAWPQLLFHALELLAARYADDTGLWVQTNGDLLDEPMLDELLRRGVQRIDVSSMDQFHPKSTLARRDYLLHLFHSRGIQPADADQAGAGQPTFAFWGATEEQWIGPLWPRGRARQHGLSAAAPEHDFCGNWSGAKHFLDYLDKSPAHGGSEVNIQLADLYPCCPMTCRPIGSLLNEPLLAMLDRCRQHPVFRALNEGRPEKMGEYMGPSEEFGRQHSRELGNHCLWCDEFFTKYGTDLLMHNATTERGTVDLDIRAGAPSRREVPADLAKLIAEKPLH